MSLVGKETEVTDANIHRRKFKKTTTTTRERLFKCKSQGSHKWTRVGQQLGLNNNALSCLYGRKLCSLRNSGLLHKVSY